MAPTNGEKKSKKKRAAAGAAGQGEGGGANGSAPAAKVARTAEGGAGGAGAAAAAAAQGGGGQEQASLYKEKPQRMGHFEVPDAQEVLEIAQTRNLYKSNLFRMQLEELIKELTPRKQHAKAEAFLHALQPVLLGLTARTIEGDFAAAFTQLCFQPQQPLYPLDFAAPTRVDIVGGFLLGTSLRSSGCVVDVAMEMPSPGFHARDYLSHRYFNKRAAYVGEVHRQLTALRAAAGKDGPLAEVELLFEAVQGDPYRPCVVLCAKDGGKGKPPWCVRLLPAVAPDLWPAAKLAPERNAVRLTEGDKVGTFPATPHYNSCVLEDAGMRGHLEAVHRALARFPALRDAVLLLKRWASSRNFLPQQSGAGGVFTPLNGFCLSAVATYAAQTASASPVEISSLQLFKLGLTVLATTDWASQKLILGKASAVALSAQEEELCGAHFYDSAGVLNFFWRLGPFIGDIKREAQRALRILDAEADPYEAVFGHTASPELEWDFLIRTPPLKVGGLCPALRKDSVPLGGLEPVDTPDSVALPARFLSVFTEGLTDRCNRVAVRFVGDVTSRWSSEPPKVGLAILVGIAIEALNMDRAVDRGPPADDEKAVARFRDIWGADKAGLRRFKDGSILECVSWPRPPSAQRKCETARRPSIVTQIVRHLAVRHFPDLASELDLVVGPIGFVPNLLDTGRHLWITFEAFRTHLCQLSSLPLTIKEVHPVDPAFSYTQVALQAAQPAPDGIQRTLYNVVVEFEGSGRWPSETEPCRKVAAAMLLQMREELQSEMGIEGDATEDFLDLRYPEVVFRVRVFHPHELLAVAHRTTNFQAKPDAPLPSKESLDRLRNLWWRPRTRITLHGHVLRQPAMAGAIRLCKRWMASQMLSGYEDFVEHLVAAVFLQPAPFLAPSSAQVGFCRVCWLLDSHDWSREPLVVDYDGKLTDEERLSMRQSFEHGRSSEEGAIFFWVCSRFDPHAFLLQTPPPTVAAWLRQRARHALSVYNRRLLGLAGAPQSGGWQDLFALDVSIFDVVLRLAKAGEPAGGRAAPPRRRKDGQRRAAAASEALLALVRKLRAQLSCTCLVFYDADSQAVAIKWRPSAFLPQHHNVLMGGVPHTMLAQPGQQPLCVPNIVYLTSAIASLAEGLVLDMKVVGARA